MWNKFSFECATEQNVGKVQDIIQSVEQSPWISTRNFFNRIGAHIQKYDKHLRT